MSCHQAWPPHHEEPNGFSSKGFAPSHNKCLLVYLALVLICETPSEDWTGRGCGEQPLVTRSQEKAATLRVTYNQTLIPGSDWSDGARGGLSLVSSRTWKSVTDQTCRQLVTITNINSQFHQWPISMSMFRSRSGKICSECR